MSEELYGESFYADRHARSLYAAVNILTLVSQIVPKIESAVDFGCGVGTWMQVLQQLGVTKILGLEGEWLNKEMLVIDEDNFMHANFSDDIPDVGRFDLAVSLEVAEHLEEQYARPFVEHITSSSDFVLFSAAIPHQKPGPEHVNEQWPNYWINIFSSLGYQCIDCIRGIMWNDVKIPAWYRQNIMFYVKNDRIDDLNLEKVKSLPNLNGLALVHPEYYLEGLYRPAMD
ncbi:methyltransferase domain-containing protein [Maridesulfovibrio sp.]|uniref:methyltransferase domain-containing protein n=1 Tax=Maridesulfovibrio sp. TaxID=2795000 RepID=UPI0029F51DAA|nr:methyltransferase domain-containing protein [Maridesulfovibrio sp.]